MARRKRQKKSVSHKFGMAAVTMVVVAMLCVLSLKMVELKEREQTYASKENSLAEQLEDEKSRSEQLEEERIYVQTKQYIEEMARERWGLVNPDEIILEPGE
jgi:cell division protein FtsB